MNICFIMYPWEDIDPENDTSLDRRPRLRKTVEEA